MRRIFDTNRTIDQNPYSNNKSQRQTKNNKPMPVTASKQILIQYSNSPKNNSVNLTITQKNTKRKNKKPYSRDSYYESSKNNIQLNHLNNPSFLERNYFSPTSNNNNKNNVFLNKSTKNVKMSNFFYQKDPNETIYIQKDDKEENLNINNINKYSTIENRNKRDHITDLLNYGNRELLYNYIGEKNINNKNYNFTKFAPENISNNELTEYYIKNATSVLEYAYKEEPNLNHRDYMEDKGICVDGLFNDYYTGIFCIFDGHGGVDVSLYLQNFFIRHLKEIYYENKNKNICIEVLLKKLFENVDKSFELEKYNQIGSTACVCFFTKEKDKKYFYCANIGDTRCIVIKKNIVKRISYDDRATDKNEIERVKKCGGIIFGGRVYGQLMLTRAFGDYELKHYGVISVPHIEKYEINFEDKYVIIASDGVWDVLSEKDVFNISLNCGNAKELCDEIIRCSMENGTMDNLSCFVIKIN